MESKTTGLETVIVYACPYCSVNIWFDKKQDLMYHIYNEHIPQVLELIANKCRETVRRKHKKWFKV